MESLKAVPTEYRGIRYRSKSEAMFSLWLAKYEGSDGVFQYEPEFAVDGWNPDFLMTCITQKDRGAYPAFVTDKCRSVNWSLPRVDLVYIEYKPSMPTSTYLSRLASVCGKFMEMAAPESFYHPDLFAFRVYVGGFYGPARMLTFEFDKFFEYEFDSNGGWITDQQRREILCTRFDLVGA